MQYLSADLIFPVAGKPVSESVLVLTDDGTVEGIFEKSTLGIEPGEVKQFNGILCPGFVNTHCHLELSWAKGLIDEGKGLDYFVRRLEELKPSVSETEILDAIRQEASIMGKSGIVATADTANTDHTLEFKSRSKDSFHTFVEIFGSNPAAAETIFQNALNLQSKFEKLQPRQSVSVVPHATYSSSGELFRLIASFSNGKRLSIHHQENEDENLFFSNGSGPISERRNYFNPDLAPFYGLNKRPVESISGYFNRDQQLLLVHNTVSEQRDVDFVNRYFSHAYWCLCPNANLYIENRLPDILLFRTNKCRITLGTDSLASNHQLSILEEIKTIQNHFPEIELDELIRWGSLNGAEFLGLDYKSGSFEKGKNPGVVLIENVDLQNNILTQESASRLIIPARL